MSNYPSFRGCKQIRTCNASHHPFSCNCGLRFQVPEFKLPQDGTAAEIRVEASTQTHIHKYKQKWYWSICFVSCWALNAAGMTLSLLFSASESIFWPPSSCLTQGWSMLVARFPLHLLWLPWNKSYNPLPVAQVRPGIANAEGFYLVLSCMFGTCSGTTAWFRGSWWRLLQ